MIGVFSVLVLTRNSFATAHDTQFWTQSILTAPLVKHKIPLRLYLEYQTRHSNSDSRKDLELLRPAIFYKLNAKFVFGLGFLSLRDFEFDELEKRIWQQIQYFDEISVFDVQLRLRLEQRFRQSNVGNEPDDSQVLNRLRFMLIAKTKQQFFGFKLFLMDELMIGLNASHSLNYPEINQGFDQNRFFLGFAYKINQTLSLDLSYIHNNILKGDGTTFVIDGGLANLVIEFI